MKRTVAFIVTACAAAALAHAADTKPLRVLLVTGGCCHDYPNQKDILEKGLKERLNVEIVHAHTPDKSTKPPLPILGQPDYAKGFDVVVHDECAAGISESTTIKGVVQPHLDGVPGVNLHCAMHCYRVGNPGQKAEVGSDRAMWFDYLGLQSSGHGPQEPIAISFVEKKSPITAGLSDWTTIKEELYNNIYVHENTKALAKGKQVVHVKKKGADGKETVTDREDETIVAWSNEFGPKKTRVFSTTIGHNNATVADARFLDLVTHGLLWACGKIDENGKPLPGYEAKK